LLGLGEILGFWRSYGSGVVRGTAVYEVCLEALSSFLMLGLEVLWDSRIGRFNVTEVDVYSVVEYTHTLRNSKRTQPCAVVSRHDQPCRKCWFRS